MHIGGLDPSGGLDVRLQAQDDRHVVKLSGELDLAGSTALRDALEGFEEGRRVVVDTTDLRFIDSSGLAVLIATRRRLGNGLVLIPGRATERLLDLSGSRSVFGLD